jgi:hypothetical protein
MFYYPKNGHIYTFINYVKSKDKTTGEWFDAVLYTDGKGMYVRNKEDFYKKFIKISEKDILEVKNLLNN